LLREARKGDIADGILAAVKTGIETPADQLPTPDRSRDKLQVNPALADLLRVLLKAKSEELGVAQKLVATASELDEIAAGLRNVPALNGWRKSAFGDDALKLCEGRLALRANGQNVEVFDV
jgi:ribonuclease D